MSSTQLPAVPVAMMTLNPFFGGMMVERPRNFGFCPRFSPNMLGVYESLGFPARTSIPQRHSLNQRCRPETEFAEDADAYYILVKLPNSTLHILLVSALLIFYCVGVTSIWLLLCSSSLCLLPHIMRQHSHAFIKPMISESITSCRLEYKGEVTDKLLNFYRFRCG